MFEAVLRPARESDREDLLRVYRAAWTSQRAHAGVDDETDLSHVDFNSLLPPDLDQIKSGELLLVATVQVEGFHEIVGYCCAKMLHESDYPGYFKNAEKVVEIKRIFTDPTYQRLGLLKKYCTAIAKFGIQHGAEEVYVCTPSKNTFEHEWFYRYGFELHSHEASICPYKTGLEILVDHDINMIHPDVRAFVKALENNLTTRFNKLVDYPEYVDREKSYATLEYVFRKNNGLKI